MKTSMYPHFSTTRTPHTGLLATRALERYWLAPEVSATSARQSSPYTNRSIATSLNTSADMSASDHFSMNFMKYGATTEEMELLVFVDRNSGGCFVVRGMHDLAAETEGPEQQVMEGIRALERQGSSRQAAKFAMTFIERQFKARNLDAVNDLLAVAAKAKGLSEWSMVGMLRSAGRAKELLPAWPVMLQHARRQMQDNNMDAEGLLLGLE